MLAATEVGELGDELDANGFVVMRRVVSKDPLSRFAAQLADTYERTAKFRGGGSITGHLNCYPGESARFVYDEVADHGIVEAVHALRPNVSTGTVEAIRSIIASVTGRTPTLGGVPFGTDAGPLGQAGIPGLVLGPGDTTQAHTKDEWIELDQVRQAAEIYYRIAVELD